LNDLVTFAIICASSTVLGHPFESAQAIVNKKQKGKTSGDVTTVIGVQLPSWLFSINLQTHFLFQNSLTLSTFRRIRILLLACAKLAMDSKKKRFPYTKASTKVAKKEELYRRE
jgi:hypothetical protein